MIQEGRERRRCATEPKGDSRTHQSFRDQCNINLIVKRCVQGNQLTHANPGQPKYGDFSNATDFREVSNLVIEAQNQFDALPSAIRKACANDPGIFLDMIGSEEGLEELEELGLLKRHKPQDLLSDEPTAGPDPSETAAPEGEEGGSNTTN